MIELKALMTRLVANREQTLAFVDYLGGLVASETADRRAPKERVEQALLTNLPLGDAYGHIGWHLMHIAANEGVSFGDERREVEWRPFQHGRPRHHPAPALAAIRTDLDATRQATLALSNDWHDDMLGDVPPGMEAAEMTYREHLDSLAWHEAYHLNQCNQLLRALFAD